jgi:hypothetical protein
MNNLLFSLGSADVLSINLIYAFQLDNLKHDFFQRNSGKHGRYLQTKNGDASSGWHHSLTAWR